MTLKHPQPQSQVLTTNHITQNNAVTEKTYDQMGCINQLRKPTSQISGTWHCSKQGPVVFDRPIRYISQRWCVVSATMRPLHSIVFALFCYLCNSSPWIGVIFLLVNFMLYCWYMIKEYGKMTPESDKGLKCNLKRIPNVYLSVDIWNGRWRKNFGYIIHDNYSYVRLSQYMLNWLSAHTYFYQNMRYEL